ncbi:MAG: hypothetical protein ACI9MR_004388, partial [Myxococcota bacterium]
MNASRPIRLYSLLGSAFCVLALLASSCESNDEGSTPCALGQFGADCEPCPGGALACSGQGECDDGRLGDGSCSCDAGYTGTACGSDINECETDNGGC